MVHSDRVIALSGVLNARELGGLPVCNGRVIKHNAFIRTGKLVNMTEEDQRVLLEKYHLAKIIDLRNNNETGEYPDPCLENVVWKQVSIFPDEQEGISREDHGMDPLERVIQRGKKFALGKGARWLLETLYAKMASDVYCIGKIKEFFDLILEHEVGAILWHCTSGKDRTGVTGCLLLYVLGADMTVIQEDYLYTNIQNTAHRTGLLQRMRDKGANEQWIHEIEVLESVEWEYMQSFLEALGDIDLFLCEKIGITEAKKRRLIEKYTEEKKKNV
ncbi:MAG: tyrosine-protein phosphatase [Erysipelotrichales bacterium]|nr:tyrosine-protein phosphatase [Erysipelotrichales bacterium]